MKFFFFYCLLFSQIVVGSFDNLIDQIYLETNKKLMFPDQLKTNSKIFGNSFVFDLKKNKISGVGSIKLTYGNMISSSDKISYNIVSKQIYIEGNALFKNNEIELKSKNANINIPNKLKAIGNVELNYKNYYASSDIAEYSLSKKVITFIDNVQFNDTQTNDVFNSNKIIFNLNTEEVLSVGKSRAKINTERSSK